MATVTERQQARRARLGAHGYKDITITVRADQAERIKTLAKACNDDLPVGFRLVPGLNALRGVANALQERGVARAGIFGSAARGSDGPESDVDVVLALHPGTELDLFALIRLKQYVADVVASALPGVRVDVSVRDHMREPVRAAVDREVVYAY